MKAFLKKQNIEISLNIIFVQAMGALAHGLFASLLIGTIMRTLGEQVTALAFLQEYANYATGVTGAAMALAVGYALKSPPFVMYSLLAVGAAANVLGGAGGPLAVFFVAIVASYAGKLVSKTTPVDIILTPFVTIVVGVFVAGIIAPPIGSAAIQLGRLVMVTTELNPLIMGSLVSAIMGLALTLPISSAALAASFSLTGVAGAAALAGCAAHMVGFAVASYRENKIGGLMAQGLGTSMLQIPNLLKKPTICIPAIVASLINGPVAIMVFGMQMNGPAIASGMGTAGLVGPIGIITGWFSPSEAAISAGAAAIEPTAFNWIGLAVVSVILPAVVSLVVSEFMRSREWIKFGDMKIEC
ncbi:MAG: PTS sugar transporter subunit IIC [Defluviitaleaceae bacterium]|nr:PTS sugar transporter subunit IIC [Defluviitaleaceae bacterium]